MARATSPPWSLWLLIVVFTAMVAALGWLAREMLGVRDEVATIRSQQQAITAEYQSLGRQGRRLEAELDRQRTHTEALGDRLAERETLIAQRESRITELERAAISPRRATAPVVASMVLSATVRSDGTPTLALPPDTDQVELRLDLQGDDDYRSFRAHLTTNGAHLWTGSELETSTDEWGAQLLVRLSAKLLANGTFELTPEGLGHDGKVYALESHTFTVARIE